MAKKKKVIIILIVIVVMAAAAGVIWWLCRHNEQSTENGIGYESQAVVVTDPDQLQSMMDQMTDDNSVALEYKNVATSQDGKNFACYLANSGKNKYDMFLTLFKDSEKKEQILLTKLIPPGSGLKKFTLDKKLDPGTYEGVLVLTQVKDDHKTIQSQTSVVYTLTVAGEK